MVCDLMPQILSVSPLWLPLLLTSRSCRCGRPLDSSGTTAQRAPWQGWVQGVWHWSLPRDCREAGGRVSANVRVQDMDLVAPNPVDNRRIEVVVDGLALPWCPTRRVHDIGLSSALGWDPAPSMRQRGRCCLGRRSGRDGLTNPPSLSASWPRPKREGSLQSSAVGPTRRGHSGGLPSWLAALPSLAILAQVHFLLFCSQVRRRTMPRSPTFRYEVIRGPRPTSVQWLKSSGRRPSPAQVQPPSSEKPVQFLPQRIIRQTQAKIRGGQAEGVRHQGCSCRVGSSKIHRRSRNLCREQDRLCKTALCRSNSPRTRRSSNEVVVGLQPSTIRGLKRLE